MKKLFKVFFIILSTIATTLYAFYTYIFVNSLESTLMWQIKTGEYIVQNKSIPQTDIFSWQKVDFEFCHEWLFDTIIYLVHKVASIQGIYLYIILITLLLLGVVYYINFKEENSILFLSFLVFCSWFFINGFVISARPYTLIVALCLLQVFILKQDISFRLKGILTFLIHVFTVNINGGLIISLLAIDILFLLLTIFYKQEVLRAAILCVIGLIGSLLNPYGLKVFTYSFKIIISANDVTTKLLEWAPFEFNTLISAIFVLFIVCSITMCRSIKLMKLNEMFELLLIIGLLTMSLVTQRVFIFFYFFYLAFGSKYTYKFITSIYNIFYKRLDCNIKKATVRKVYNSLVCMLLIISTGLCTYTIKEAVSVVKIGFTSTEEELLAQDYSLECIEYLKKNKAQNILSYSIEGDFLIYNNLKSFIDGRQYPFIKEFTNNDSYREVYAYKEITYLMTLCDKYNIQYLYLPYNEDTINVLQGSGDWDLAVKDSNGLIFKRKVE